MSKEESELLRVAKKIYADLDDRYDVDEESGTGHKREYPYSGVGEHLMLLRAAIEKTERQYEQER